MAPIEAAPERLRGPLVDLHPGDVDGPILADAIGVAEEVGVPALEAQPAFHTLEVVDLSPELHAEVPAAGGTSARLDVQEVDRGGPSGRRQAEHRRRGKQQRREARGHAYSDL
jgi:hypothetical protein